MGRESLAKRESVARSGVSFAGVGGRRDSRIPVSISEMKTGDEDILLVKRGTPVNARRRGLGATNKRDHSPFHGSQH